MIIFTVRINNFIVNKNGITILNSPFKYEYFQGIIFQKMTTSEMTEQPSFSEGDIFYTQSGNNYHIFKLLAIDEDFDCYHILAFSPLDGLPTISSIEDLSVSVYHSPFDKHAFAGATLLTNKTVTSDDLIGYHEYLRRTQDPSVYLPIANNYYKSGFELANEKKHFEAIDAYSKAIDLFPQFYEAIDNRAFCKMDLALWMEAIEDFKLSLEQNPNSFLAEFSIGECYFKLGDLENAKQQFDIAHHIDPSHMAPRQFLNRVNELLNT